MFDSDPNFQAIANLVSDLLWCNDRQGNIWYNQRWLEYTGQTLAEDYEYGWLDAIHPSDRTHSSIDFQNALAEGRFLQQELRLRAASGEYRWFSVRVEFQRDESGRITHWFGVATEIRDRRIAREQLQGSSELLPKIIEHLPVGAVFVVDRHLRYLLAEGEALHSAGFKPEDLVGRTIYEVIPPELIPEHEELYEIGFGGESFTREHNAHDSTYVSRGTPLRDANGEVYGVLAVSYDITERKRVEEELRLAAELNAFRVILSDALRSQSDPVEIQGEAARVLGEHLKADRVMYGEVEKTDEVAVVRRDYCREKVATAVGQYRFDNFGGYIIKMMRDGITVKVADVKVMPKHSDTELAKYEAVGVRAYIAVPLIKENRLAAYLGVNQLNPREWTPQEVALVEETAERTWAAVERACTETALQKSEAKYSALFNSIDEGFCIVEVLFDADRIPFDHRILQANPTFEKHSGISNPEGKTASELAPGIEQYWNDLYAQVIKTGEAIRTEMHSEALNRWFGVLVSRIDEARMNQVAILFTNITDRKRREQDRVMLLEVSQELVSLDNIAETMNSLGKKIGQYFGVNQCVFSELSEDFEISVTNYGWNVEGSPSLIGRYRMGDFLTDEQIEAQMAGEVSIVNDTQTDPRVSAEGYSMLGIRSFVIVPLVRNNWRFMLSLIDDEPRQWREDEVDLMQQITNRIWTRLERVRAEATIRESELQRVREQSAREEEQQRAETLAELDRAKIQFFSNVSHEFRTPLTLLLAPLQDALEDLKHPLPNPHRQRLELARRNGLRLLKLVNTLLDFSRVEEGRLQANYESTDLASYTVELASTFRSAIENEELHLVVDCPPLPEPIYVDRQMWSKIVSNLLSNAFKFTFTGIISISLKLIATETSDMPANRAELNRRQMADGRWQKVNCSDGDFDPNRTKTTYRRWGFELQRDKFEGDPSAICPSSEASSAFRSEATLIVSDTGTGIPAEELPYIFERFYQSKGTRGRSYEGSGIGLSLVQELIKLHHGEITVSSEVDRGTTFRVTLPTGSAHLPPEHLENASIPSSTAMPSSLFVSEAEHWLSEESTVESQNLEFNAQRILIVDDNGDLRNYLQRLLSKHYQVETANDGLAALTAIRQATQSYDLVLADIIMPVMDGLELLRSLRTDPDTQDIPIILLSARASEESEIIGLEAKADDYLFKPFSAKELLARVKTNLELTQMRREVTYRKQVTQEIQALNKTLEYRVQERTAQLEAINQELEAFSYSVSHDLQTPLSYISSFGEKLQAKLKSTHLDPTSQRYLKIMVESAERCQEMVQNLLEFSRLEQTQMQRTSISMEQLVQQVRQQLQPELEGRSLQWQIESLPEVRGDREMLRLVWQNLFSNAVKYTRDRTPAKITVGSFQRNGETIFFVRDNGVGFDMKYRDRLFTLFQRLHSQEFPGTGVGLAHVRRIIHRHGGKIWAESEIGQGAVFHFTVNSKQ
ncbi:PAS domain S-box protein [Pleurocapsales cyanobacterium LEGE 10410]|nr:PAS domain S-box protein [Pleurocapsales cyanobacterium LEGE 10410]